MLARVKSYGLNGIVGCPITVEVDLSYGLIRYDTVGLPDNAVKESRERVRSAIINSGFSFPDTRVVVNLAPADIRKEGTVYDLPIALGILSAQGIIPKETSSKYVIIGELALDGSVRGVKGVLPMIIDAYDRNDRFVMIPAENADEASCVEGMTVIPVKSLGDACDFLRGNLMIEPYPTYKFNSKKTRYSYDFSQIRGQYAAKRGAEIAVSGSHNLLMVGSPGSGKTMLAKSLPSILPELTMKEALEVTRIYSVLGELKSGIVTERPFRAPHHSASAPSIVGGGSKALPGEISLAHFGVLFMDEFPYFPANLLEALRQPLEDGIVTITRAAVKATYPADFMLVAAMNPCPCGNYGSNTKSCRCTPSQIEHYRKKISAPLLDRLDIHVEMNDVGYDDLASKVSGESSEVIRERVCRARELQRRRYGNEGIMYNSQLDAPRLRKYCKMDSDAELLLRAAYDRLKLSARAYTRVIKVARTIADIEGVDIIEKKHVAEAVQFRGIDEKYWGVR